MNKTKHFVGMRKFSSFSTGKNSSKTIASEENCPLILALTLKLTQTQAIFFRDNWPDTGKSKKTKNRKEIKNNRMKKE